MRGAEEPERGSIIFTQGSNYGSFLEALATMDYAVFDFDGTLYPGLFIFDLTRKVFLEHNGESAYRDKLEKPKNIATIYKGGDFKSAYTGYVSLLKNEDRGEFISMSRKLISNSYKSAGAVIRELKEKYGIRAYLISLTADFVAEIAQEHLGLAKAFSVGYLSESAGSGERFSGKTDMPIEDPQQMKERMLSRLVEQRHAEGKFACFFDSTDDLPIAKKASLRVGINPKPGLSGYKGFDIILSGDADPWAGFLRLL